MKKMRLLLALTLIFIFSLSAASCGDKEERIIASVDDLTGSVIGVQLGTTGDIYVSDYEGDDAGTSVIRHNKGADAIQSLKQGKVDAVVIDSEPAKAFVKDNSDLIILKDPFENEDYAIAVAKENTALLSKINEAIKQIKENGTLDLIIDNYIGDNVGKSPFTPDNSLTRENGELVMATNAAFKPYEYLDNGKIVGLDVDMARAIADYLNMELVINDIDFDAVIIDVQSGKADIGVAGLTVTEERLKNINFSDPYTNSTQVIIVKNPEGGGNVLTIAERFENSFIKDNNYVYLLKGLGNTLLIALFACIIGIILGFLIALVRVSYDKNKSLKVLNWFCKLYLTIIRGTPVMIQLLIMYYIIFSSVNVNKLLVAVIAFGLNSAAYVAEIFRSGIMSIDDGQFEAGRSLGLNFNQTMRFIIAPQAFKNVLPALGNEFIVLLKETSISGYIGLMDVTRGGDILRSITYDPFMPLLSVLVIYLLLVGLLSRQVGKLERRLRKNER